MKMVTPRNYKPNPPQKIRLNYLDFTSFKALLIATSAAVSPCSLAISKERSNASTAKSYCSSLTAKKHFVNIDTSPAVFKKTSECDHWPQVSSSFPRSSCNKITTMAIASFRRFNHGSSLVLSNHTATHHIFLPSIGGLSVWKPGISRFQISLVKTFSKISSPVWCFAQKNRRSPKQNK